jgi:hypothetical protein
VTPFRANQGNAQPGQERRFAWVDNEGDPRRRWAVSEQELALGEGRSKELRSTPRCRTLAATLRVRAPRSRLHSIDSPRAHAFLVEPIAVLMRYLLRSRPRTQSRMHNQSARLASPARAQPAVSVSHLPPHTARPEANGCC